MYIQLNIFYFVILKHIFLLENAEDGKYSFWGILNMVCRGLCGYSMDYISVILIYRELNWKVDGFECKVGGNLMNKIEKSVVIF